MRVYGSWVLKVRVKHVYAVFLKGYTETFKRFPQNSLGKNVEIALNAKDRIFRSGLVESEHKISEEEVTELESFLNGDPWTMSVVADSHRLEAFYYSFSIRSEIFKDKVTSTIIANIIAEARGIDASLKDLSYNDVAALNKKISKELKELDAKTRKLNSERLEQEKLNTIKKITIEASEVVFALGIFSTLFVLSGFIYTRLFFSTLGVDVADFFVTSDYLAVSVSVLASTALPTVAGLISYVWGLSSDLLKKIHRDQFALEKTKNFNNYMLPVILLFSIVLSSSVALVVSSYRTGELPTIFLFPLVSVTLFYGFYRLPLWKYIENTASVTAFLITLLLFGMHLGFRIKDDIAVALNPQSKSEYVLSMRAGYTEYSNHKFLSQNSRFVFLISKESARVSIIPADAVLSFESADD